MRFREMTRVVCGAAICLCLLAGPAWPAPAAGAGVKTVAYFEAGPYWEFSLLYKEVMAALERHNLKEYVRTPDNLRISPGWGRDRAEYLAEARRLMQDPSVDLIISMGTEATTALLAENNGRTPIVSIDVADPAGAGIVDADTGKGAANLIIQYVKDKWWQVFALFHKAVPFARLGIMYHDSPEGLSYSNVNEAREVARERGFTLVEYGKLDKAESYASCEEGVQALLDEGIDAFYISALNCFDWTQGNPEPMISRLHAAGVRTFARDGSVHVRRGVLMGLSTIDYRPTGEFYAERIGRALALIPAGQPLADIKYQPKITINLVTARELGMDIPLVLLVSSDEIFDSSLAEVKKAIEVQ